MKCHVHAWYICLGHDFWIYGDPSDYTFHVPWSTWSLSPDFWLEAGPPIIALMAKGRFLRDQDQRLWEVQVAQLPASLFQLTLQIPTAALSRPTPTMLVSKPDKYVGDATRCRSFILLSKLHPASLGDVSDSNKIVNIISSVLNMCYNRVGEGREREISDLQWAVFPLPNVLRFIILNTSVCIFPPALLTRLLHLSPNHD